ncbi:UDP-N-acetylglucosamine 2-epimerase [Candidatus Bipolaricaulota bacterium]
MDERSRRRIAVITGTRAEYGIVRPVLREIDAHPDLELCLIAMAQHLSPEFGCTVREIESDGFVVSARLETLQSSDTGGGMARALGLAIIQLAQVMEMLKPDIIVATGDRGEMLAAAIIGAHMNIPVAHQHGGEISGTVDESIRHAITKFAHIHLPATQQSAERIRRLGEDADRIHVVGAAGLDQIREGSFLSPEDVSQELDLDLAKPVILVSQHPVTTEIEVSGMQMRETMEAIRIVGFQTVLIYPNSDAGGRSMCEVIDEYGELPFIRRFVNAPRDLYLGVMNLASVMVGNSSSGIIEAPSFHLPFVNVGTRQTGRERGGNVVDVAHDRDQIAGAIRFSMTDLEFRASVAKTPNPYDYGPSVGRVADILSGVKINRDLIQKRMAVE